MTVELPRIIHDTNKSRFPNFSEHRVLGFDDQSARAQECWKQWQNTELALIVFDDIEDFADTKLFFPPEHFSNLVVVGTTRLLRSGDFVVGRLSEKASLELLASPKENKRRIDDEKEESKLLCGELGYLPLALELVSRYLAVDSSLTISKLRQELKKEGMIDHEALIRDDSDGTWELTAMTGIKAAFERSWKYLNEKGLYTALAIGFTASLLANEEFSWNYLEEILQEDYDSELLEKGKRNLVRLSLLEQSDKSNEIYCLHPLVREYFQSKSIELNGA
jgi:hypothetical protein